MATDNNDVDLTDKAELEHFLKESGLDNIIDAMKKSSSRPKKSIESKHDIDWIQDIIKTFEPLHLNLNSYYVEFIKLLDYMGKVNFSGFMFIHIHSNTSTLFMWNGEINGIINTELDLIDEEVIGYTLENYQDAAIDIYLNPEDKGALPLILNSIARNNTVPKYKDLDTQFTDVSKLISKLEEEKLTGHISMKTPQGQFYSCLYNGKEILTSFLDNNNKYTDSTLKEIRNETGIVNIYESKVRTLVSNMDDVMNKTTVMLLYNDENGPTLQRIVNEFKGHVSLNVAQATRDNTNLKVNFPAGLANRDDCESFKEQIYRTREFKFIKYFYIDYFLNIAESRNTFSLKNIWNYIPQAKVIKFKQKYIVGNTEHFFDIIMYDGSGRLIFAIKYADRTPNSYDIDIFLKQLENIKLNQNDWSNLKGGFFISMKGFENKAISAAYKASSGAVVKNVLGKIGGLKVPDIIAAPKGFIKSQGDEGFHINLIHQKEDSFEIVFPEL